MRFGLRLTRQKYFWVTLERWDALRPREIEDELKRAHAQIYEKLSKRTKAVLAMPKKERARLIKERRKALRSSQQGKGNRGKKAD